MALEDFFYYMKSSGQYILQILKAFNTTLEWFEFKSMMKF